MYTKTQICKVSTIEVTFRQWLSILRKKLGMTQRELASQLSYSTHSIKCYEEGRRQPTAKLLQKILLLLNQKTQHLLLVSLAGVQLCDDDFTPEALQQWKETQDNSVKLKKRLNRLPNPLQTKKDVTKHVAILKRLIHNQIIALDLIKRIVQKKTGCQ